MAGFLLDRRSSSIPSISTPRVELTDRMVEKGFGDHVALIGNGRRRTYKELADWTNRLAHALVENYGVKPGNRVLIRSGNNPAMVAALAGRHQGRCGRRQHDADAAFGRIDEDRRQGGDRPRFVRQPHRRRAGRVRQGQPIAQEGRRLRRHGEPRCRARSCRARQAGAVRAVRTGRDDVALLGFTSGTTGEPKATMHFHRDLLIIADGYAKEVLRSTPDDMFVGSPPLAFTFGLGGLAIFPLRFGATATLLENASPPNMIDIIENYKATISFTAPTAYRAMMAAMDKGADLSSLRDGRVGRRNAAGAGLRRLDAEDRQADPRRHRRHRNAAHLHQQPLETTPAGATGRPVTGYEARIVDEDMQRGAARHGRTPGRARARPAAVISPTTRRRSMCATAGTSPAMLSSGTSAAISISPRAADDMIISSGYNIAGPEVEVGAACPRGRHRVRRDRRGRRRAGTDRRRRMSC